MGHFRFSCWRRGILVLILLSTSQSLFAETYKERFTDGIYFELEQFLREDTDSNDQRLRNEFGQRIALGMGEDNLGWKHPGIIYEASGQGMLGIVYYDDYAPKSILNVSQEKLTTKADYLGVNLHGAMGQRYGYISEHTFFEALFGLDAEAWVRNIRNGSNRGLTAIGRGSLDFRGTISPSVSAGFSTWWGGHREMLHIGLKYPIYVEYFNLDARINLQPQGQFSLFGHFDVTRLFRLRGHWMNLRLFADTTRFLPTTNGTNYNNDKSLELRIGVRLMYNRLR